MAAPINPKGAKSDKIWRDAIMRSVRRLETDAIPKDAKPRQRLEVLADKLVTKGIAGDVGALRELGDRLDGKPTQPIAGDDDFPPIRAKVDASGLTFDQLKALASIKVE